MMKRVLDYQGGGVKFYPAEKVGFKLRLRWTPTHIRSDTSGIFCNSRYGCWLIGPSKYSNQVDLAPVFYSVFGCELRLIHRRGAEIAEVAQRETEASVKLCAASEISGPRR
jgi:hypothetical protein